MIRPREWVAAQIVLLIAVVVVGGGPTFATPWWSTALGIAMIVAGFALAIAAGRALGVAFTPSPAPNGLGELCTAGPFRRVRHPTYLAVLIAYLGVVIVAGTWGRVALWLVMLAFFNLKARYEERLLRGAFRGYDTYASTTGRLLPRRPSAPRR